MEEDPKEPNSPSVPKLDIWNSTGQARVLEFEPISINGEVFATIDRDGSVRTKIRLDLKQQSEARLVARIAMVISHNLTPPAWATAMWNDRKVIISNPVTDDPDNPFGVIVRIHKSTGTILPMGVQCVRVIGLSAWFHRTKVSGSDIVQVVMGVCVLY